MLKGTGKPGDLPYGYGIGRVQQVSRTQMDVKKDREKQNEEKRANLLRQKSFIEELRHQMEIQRQNQENEEKGFNRKM